MSVFHVRVTTAALIGLATTVVGGVVAVAPALAPDKRIIIAALTGVITTVGLLVNAIHAVAGAKLSAKNVEENVQAEVEAALRRILTVSSKQGTPNAS